MLKKIVQIIVGFAIVIGICVVLYAVVKSGNERETAISKMPYFVLTPGGFGAGPNYYCERIDTEKRIAYNCIPTGKIVLVVYPEYHLSQADSFLHR